MGVLIPSPLTGKCVDVIDLDLIAKIITLFVDIFGFV